LRRSEYELLRAFLAAPGRALSRDHLLDAVAGRHSDPFDRSVDVLVGRLRRKIEPEPSKPRLIVTVPGVGYRFTAKPQPVSAASAATPAPLIATLPPSPERRQVTVMQCRLCGSALASARRDPEDLQRLVTVFHEHAKSVIAESGGTVDRLLGDGIVAYFGFPQADENQAERAIRTALKLAETTGRVGADPVGPLQVRIGVASGLALVGGEPAVLGEAAHLAAGLVSRAEPDAVLIAAGTRRLVGELFKLRACAPSAMDSADEPVEAWAVEGLSASESRFDSMHGSRLTDFVGRAHELGLLTERWSLARDGEGQVVLLSGEPGIGKSRILRELRDRLERVGASSLRFQCSPYHVNSAFYPIIDNFERALHVVPDESPEAKLEKLEALIVKRYGCPQEDARFIAAMLSIPYEARYGAIAMTPQRFKDETLRALVDVVAAIARQSPTVLLFEDAHWADPTTLEALDRLVHQVRNTPLLVVITHRPEFSPRWSQHGHVTALSLSKLTRPQSAAMVSRLAGGKALPAELLEQVLDKTDGVPLFIEELTKSILESAGLRDAGDRWEYAGPAGALAIPLTLRDSLVARLDRVAPGKEVAQIGAVIGREFSHPLIAAVASHTKPELEQALAQLTASGLAFQQGTPPDAVYTFKHALVRDAAYESLLKQRRQALHGKIARAIEACLPNTEATEPELLAHHHTEARQPERAIPLWQKAGELALRRLALAEAVAHLNRGLGLVAALAPSAERDGLELDLRTTLGTTWMARRG
ncbi:MAG: AAA family ATPase, partial [Solirubrobacterales bacterium]|nr:AAA family ATPase [Solirubrobacterales bacterium]